jgi:hypothetical protein
MGGRWAWRFSWVLLAVACGCHNNRRDLVEAELRAKEMELRDVQDALSCTRAHNHALEVELRTLHGEGYPPGIPGDHAGPVYPVTSILLGRQTGGHPSDHGHGDDALQVQVEPRDPEGHGIKVPHSALYVEAVEITSEGLKHPLSSWEVPPEELRNTWRSGLFSTGYSVTLPWKVWPTTERLRVVARLRLADGRTFEADKDVTIRLTPGVHPPASSTPATPVLPTPTPSPSPSQSPGTPVLPAPKPVPPEKPSGPELPPPPDNPPPGVWNPPVPEPAAEMRRPVVLTGDR